MEMVRVLLLGVPVVPFEVEVFDGGPKSHGDELIVRTSRFFAEPGIKEQMKRNEKRALKINILRWDNFPDCCHLLEHEKVAHVG